MGKGRRACRLRLQSAVPRSKSCSRIFMHRSREFFGTVRQYHPIVRRPHQRSQSLFCTRQMVRNNLHNCAECYPTKKRGHIVGPHSDATVAGWTPDHFLLGRAVNVNASAKSMRVGHFQTAQPNDAGDNGITPGRIRLENFAGPVAIVKHGSRGRVVANFLHDLQKPKWRCHPPPTIAETEILRLTFSSHDVEIAGRNLRALLLALQDFAVKWLRSMPERYA